jgi:hypothetical protein
MTGRPVKTFLIASFAIIFGVVQIACFCSPGFAASLSFASSSSTSSSDGSQSTMLAVGHAMGDSDHSSDQHPDVDCDNHCLDQQVSAVKPLAHNSFIAGSNAPDKVIVSTPVTAPSWLEIPSPQRIVKSWIDPPKPRLSPVALKTRLLN